MAPNNTILFTGGGSAGHVTPNIALIQRFKELGWTIHYIGSEAGIEREITKPLDLQYHAISTGKLHRFITWKNLLMPVRVLKGIWQSIRLIHTIQPKVIFSKGGFVSLPVVIGAWVNRVPTLIHEADITPGLANKLSAPFAKRICVTNELATKHYKKTDKLLVTGIPVRPDLYQGDATKARTFCQFTDNKPVIFVFGGSLGSGRINQLIRALLPQLLPHYQIAHICGKNNVDTSYQQTGYCQFEYVNDEMADLYALADLVISRAGANTVYELLSLKKPHILIPLPTTYSRGDQIDNAKYYAEHQLSQVIFEENLTQELLLKTIEKAFAEREATLQHMSDYALPNSTQVIEQAILGIVS